MVMEHGLSDDRVWQVELVAVSCLCGAWFWTYYCGREDKMSGLGSVNGPFSVFSGLFNWDYIITKILCNVTCCDCEQMINDQFVLFVLDGACELV